MVDGLPFPTIQWYRENVLLKENGRTRIEIDDKSGICSLTINSSRVEDMGEYECMAKNRAGEASTYCEVTIDQVSDSDELLKSAAKSKGVRRSKETKKIDLAKGMSTDEVIDSDGQDSIGK